MPFDAAVCHNSALCCFSKTKPLQAFVQFPALLRGVISDLLTRRLCWCRQLAVRHWGNARFRRLQQEPGIRCLVMSGTCLPCSPFAANSRLYCLGCRAPYPVECRLTVLALFRDTDIVRWSCSCNVTIRTFSRHSGRTEK